MVYYMYKTHKTLYFRFHGTLSLNNQQLILSSTSKLKFWVGWRLKLLRFSMWSEAIDLEIYRYKFYLSTHS